MGGVGGSLIGRLRRRQNRCVGLCSGITQGESEQLYMAYKLLPFDKIYSHCVGVRFFCYYKLNRNLFFNEQINELRCTHGYQTRFSVDRKLNVPYCRLSTCQSLFLYRAVHCWNDIPKLIKDSPSFPAFKSQLRKLLFSFQ